MQLNRIIQFSILVFWTCFWGLSVVDKIIPDVFPFWVGKDFFALFVKFFASIGLKEPIFPTLALSFVSILEVFVFVAYFFSLFYFFRKNSDNTKKWFFISIIFSSSLFALFSIADQVFGDRFQLLEHGLFWIILIMSWFLYKYVETWHEEKLEFKNKAVFKLVLAIGICLTILISISILGFSNRTIKKEESPVIGEEVVEGLYKFDFPFLADKRVWENTILNFKKKHPELKINYIYTGPTELNTKKKTHMLLYLFTEKREVESLDRN